MDQQNLISRQAAIDLVRDVCDAIMSGCESWYDPETEDEVYKDIREVDAILKCNKEVRIALRNMPSAQPEQPWIPCSERFPEQCEWYIITLNTGNVAFGYWSDLHGWIKYDDHIVVQEVKPEPFEWVLAWAPLPKPWGGEKE